MFDKLRALLTRFNDYTMTLQSVLFWRHLLFWLAVLVGLHFGLISVVTQSYAIMASSPTPMRWGCNMRPLSAMSRPAPVTVIAGR